MTPKQHYDAARQAKRIRQMAEDERWTARERREKIADEAITTMREGMKAFFEGRATLQLGPIQPGIGQSVRFVKD
jgi:hypothetical protein